MKELGELRKPIGSRTTLKLKTSGRSPSVAPGSPPSGRTHSVAPASPPKTLRAAKTLDWADEHKQRMQADMDALGSGNVPSDQRRGR